MIEDEDRNMEKYCKKSFHRFAPYCYSKTDAGNLVATRVEDATHVFVDSIPGLLYTGRINYNFYGSIIDAEALESGTETFVYYKIDQQISGENANLMGILSRHFSNDMEYYYNDLASISNFTKPFEVWEKRTEGRLKVRDIRNLKADPISGDHHVHFTAEEVLSCLQNRNRVISEVVKLPADVTTTFVAGFMMWVDNLGDKLYEKVLSKINLSNSASMEEFAKRGKLISVRAKSYQHITNMDLKKLFEIDVLVNRMMGKFDWKKEKENRTNPNLAKLGADRIYKEACILFGSHDNNAEKPRKMTWDKYWKARWQWSASGSIHSQYPEDTEKVPKHRELKNKFIALSLEPKRDLAYYFSRPPSIVAWSSIKYEWGKLRAIYGTDLTSYILSNFAFFNIEDTLPSMFPVGKKANERFVKARVSAVLEKAIPLCLDFEDFNSQHSIPGMQAVMRAWLDCKRDSLTWEQILAAEWSIAAIAKTRIIDNMGLNEEYMVTGTLMSGWRLTTFVNSVLNYVYTKVMLQDEKSGYYRSVHNGDDVLIGVNNFKVARNAVKAGLVNNIRLQLTKCSFGSLAEFLRVDHSSGDTGQYLTRSIATMMHSRIESKVAVRHADLVESMENRFADFVNRGGSIRQICRLRDVYFEKIDSKYARGGKSSWDIKTTHRVAGGIVSTLDGRVDKMIISEGYEEESDLPAHLPGVLDYGKEIHAALQLDVKVDEVQKELFKATLKAVQMKLYTTSVVDNENVKLYEGYRALYKAHHDESDKKEFGKAKLVGMLIDVLNLESNRGPLIHMLNMSSDPIKFLSVVS